MASVSHGVPHARQPCGRTPLHGVFSQTATLPAMLTLVSMQHLEYLRERKGRQCLDREGSGMHKAKALSESRRRLKHTAKAVPESWRRWKRTCPSA